MGIGKAFMQMMIVSDNDIEYFSDFFGKLIKIKIENNEWIVITNWRRLTVTKCCHLRDSFYSSLSSTMNSILSNNIDFALEYQKYIYIYSYRNLISFNTTQQIAEFLMDTRYA